MKGANGAAMVLGVALACGIAAAAVAQESRTDVRLENDHVLVIENLYDPGAESPLHTHDHPRVVYVLAGGELELVPEDGRPTRVQVRPGQTLWRPAETHVVRNVGRTTVRTLETEVKAATEGSLD